MPKHESIPRFYVPSLTGEDMSLPDDQARHATGVLRLRAGAAVEVFDGLGKHATGEITRANRREVTVRVDNVQRTAEPAPRLHVAFSVPKGKRLDWLLEKATELAAASLQPILFERSVAGGEELTPAKRARWEGHCIAAAKQSGLDWLPELRDTQTLPGFLADDSRGLPLVGDVAPKTPLLSETLSRHPSPDDVILLVGPEGGFAPAEKEAIVRANFQPARLGTTTLRVETAVVAMLAGARAILNP